MENSCLRAVAYRFLDRRQPRLIHFHCNGPLQQRHRKNDSMISLQVYKNPFKPSQSSVIHADSLSHFQVRPGLFWRLRDHSHLQRSDLIVGDWNRRTSDSDNLQHTRSQNQGPALLEIKSTKQVPGEKRLFNFSPSIRPVPDALVSWKQAFKTLSNNLRSNIVLPAGSDLEGIPGQIRHGLLFRASQQAIQSFAPPWG